MRIGGGLAAPDPDAELRELIRHQHQKLKDRQGLREGYGYVLRDIGMGGGEDNVEGLLDTKNSKGVVILKHYLGYCLTEQIIKRSCH